MKTRAAVLRKAGTPWEVTELELDAPRANEVLIRMEAAGINDGYQDLMDGENIRGVVVHSGS